MFPFFRKKDPLPEDAAKPRAPSNRRREYRVRKNGLHVLAVRLVDARGRPCPCDCEDLSLGGVALSLPSDQAQGLVPGLELMIEFQALSRQNGVRTKGRIVKVATEGNRTRCGLVFLDTAALVRQIDAHYARFFNRRRYLRVLPDLSTRFKIQLTWGKETLDARAQDFSIGGLGLVLSPAEAERMSKVRELEARFQLPDCKTVLVLRSRVASLRPLTKGVLLGLEFLPDRSADAEFEALRTFVEARIAKMSQWNAAAQRKAI